MHLTVRAGAVIFLLSVAAIAGAKPGILWDAGGVTGPSHRSGTFLFTR